MGLWALRIVRKAATIAGRRGHEKRGKSSVIQPEFSRNREWLAAAQQLRGREQNFFFHTDVLE
jgi:hypothetical protein